MSSNDEKTEKLKDFQSTFCKGGVTKQFLSSFTDNISYSYFVETIASSFVSSVTVLGRGFTCKPKVGYLYRSIDGHTFIEIGIMEMLMNSRGDRYDDALTQRDFEAVSEQIRETMLMRTGRHRARRNLPDHKIYQVIGICGYNVLLGVIDTRGKTNQQLVDMFEKELIRTGLAANNKGIGREGQLIHGWRDHCTDLDPGHWVGSPADSLDIVREEYAIPPPPMSPAYIISMQIDAGVRYLIVHGVSGERLAEVKVSENFVKKNAEEKLRYLKKRIREEVGTKRFDLFTEDGTHLTPSWLHNELSDVGSTTNVNMSYFRGGEMKKRKSRRRRGGRLKSKLPPKTRRAKRRLSL